MCACAVRQVRPREHHSCPRIVAPPARPCRFVVPASLFVWPVIARGAGRISVPSAAAPQRRPHPACRRLLPRRRRYAGGRPSDAHCRGPGEAPGRIPALLNGPAGQLPGRPAGSTAQLPASTGTAAGKAGVGDAASPPADAPARPYRAGNSSAGRKFPLRRCLRSCRSCSAARRRTMHRPASYRATDDAHVASRTRAEAAGPLNTTPTRLPGPARPAACQHVDAVWPKNNPPAHVVRRRRRKFNTLAWLYFG